MDIKDKIKYLRKNRGWTVTDLAKKAKVGQSTISQIELGRNKPSAKVLEKLSVSFEVSTDYLLGKSEKSNLPLKIKDKDLLWHFQEIDKLSKEDKKVVKRFLNAFLKERPPSKTVKRRKGK